jgi:hypothetical protein
MKTVNILSPIQRRLKVWKCAFARLELIACLGCLTLLIALALPALAATPSRSHMAQCLNNLRFLGRAVEMWGSDHEGEPPWRTYVSRGGTRPDSGLKPGNAWFEFTALSNELTTPRILACPADVGVKVASEFSSQATRGYMATGFRAVATSYLVSLDNRFADPKFLLSADRNIRFTSIAPCVNGINNADNVDRFDFSAGKWTNAVHGLQGQVLRTDGAGLTIAADQLRTEFFSSFDDNSSFHFLRAR